MKNLYESRLNYLSNNVWKIEPCYNPFIDFFSLKNEEESIYSSILNIGMIDEYDVSPEKCLILRDEKERIYENEEFKFEIISYSKDGNEMRNGGNGMNFTIQTEGKQKNEKQKDNEIVDLNNGKYEVKMKLKDEGKYLIFVKFNGININSSPFQIQIFSKLKQRNYNEIIGPKLTFGSDGNGNGQFNSIYGITINSKGNIIVSDTDNHRIQIFDCEGNFILTSRRKGKENGQFSSPFGITINSKGNILVCDFGNHRIQIFDSEGKFVSKFGSKGNGNGQFNYPYGICVDKSDKIYVCDYNNHRIQIFDSYGKFISTFGSKGNGNGQFDYPRGIAINSKGNIIVSDDNNRIQIFDSEGNFISKFGSEGSGNGEFNNPFGGCVDLDDNIFVCDNGNNRIQIFDSNGKYINQIEVNKPTNITIDPKTQNIIVSQYDHQVSIFWFNDNRFMTQQ